ncbi:hypothetical protein [Streptomyces sp. H51]|uniref:hypothetical protein n=1 Tax=Streptomyces sp. H51 TaxID=3111770 RepID=UPI002D787693|nr:hypothetical protein [Streptomyces sp. H51]
MANEELQPVLVSATCHTVGCPVEGVTYTGVPMYPSPVPPTFNAVCGQCGQPVTDIVQATTA